MIYFYAEKQTTHTSYTDGLEVYRFANQQVGRVRVLACGSTACITEYPFGEKGIIAT